MALIDQVTKDMAQAMKAHDQPRLAALRMLKSAIMNREVEKGRGLEPAEDSQVVQQSVKQRRAASAAGAWSVRGSKGAFGGLVSVGMVSGSERQTALLGSFGQGPRAIDPAGWSAARATTILPG